MAEMDCFFSKDEPSYPFKLDLDSGLSGVRLEDKYCTGAFTFNNEGASKKHSVITFKDDCYSYDKTQDLK